MSAVVRTLTPFTEQDVLYGALVRLGVKVTVKGQNLLTNRSDYRGQQSFLWDGKAYRFTYDSDEHWSGRVISRSLNKQYTPVSQFLKSLELVYKSEYESKLERIAEEERQRLEQERIARVEATKLAAIKKAEAQGYRVKEQRKNGKIQLVLTRTVY
ncbi:hypothetical protein [Endozoicomonas euniceicola]|uniref:Uncharacterized protein n=1 Tax=Endozoicomonas euniceicola TaxID=1234143 RepID=A0ABY6GV35_9GAMM|nr:hypothetical protein [Endozoicomonas euniceicola]UYM15898.1 hypothetical protein NX720_24275 [Endozoicomonas euniceicola]